MAEICIFVTTIILNGGIFCLLVAGIFYALSLHICGFDTPAWSVNAPTAVEVIVSGKGRNRFFISAQQTTFLNDMTITEKCLNGENLPYSEQSEEIWKDIKGYEGTYQVSNFGNVKSLYRKVPNGVGFRPISEKTLKPLLGKKNGYLSVPLHIGGHICRKYVHRLVASAFIPNPENKKDVNHLNGEKTDNHVQNLEWVTRSENQKHAFGVGLNKANTIPVLQFSLDGKFIAEHESLSNAALSVGGRQGNISKCCKGIINKTSGFIWRYRE